MKSKAARIRIHDLDFFKRQLNAENITEPELFANLRREFERIRQENQQIKNNKRVLF